LSKISKCIQKVPATNSASVAAAARCFSDKNTSSDNLIKT